MKKFINLSKQERKNIIQKAAFDLGLRFDIVEKDLWVCFVLDKLFSLKELEGKLIFKGGTCLSKAYNLISRFSEDVDITINKNCLKIEGVSKKPRNIISNIRHACDQFVQDEIHKLLQDAFSKEFKENDWSLTIDPEDKSTLFFAFPSAGSNAFPLSFPIEFDDSYQYIKPSIKIEFGALGDDFPSEDRMVEPYAKKILPEMFQAKRVKVLDAKRNFLEKLLILHSIYYRPIEKPLRNHYSRHYYDVFALINGGVGNDALDFPDILASVIKNKIDFWNETWKPYDTIKSFSDIRLIPVNEARIKELEGDYEKMKEMFFGSYPTFSEIIDGLSNFEEKLKRMAE